MNQFPVPKIHLDHHRKLFKLMSCITFVPGPTHEYWLRENIAELHFYRDATTYGIEYPGPHQPTNSNQKAHQKPGCVIRQNNLYRFVYKARMEVSINASWNLLKWETNFLTPLFSPSYVARPIHKLHGAANADHPCTRKSTKAKRAMN